MSFDMKDRINEETKGKKMYEARFEEYQGSPNDNFNFRVSQTPFKLNKNQKDEMLNIGKAICDYMDACIELYKTDEHVRLLLDRGKPLNLINAENPKYLFLRPDLLLTEDGFSICEIETSPFGLGLAEVLNRAYGNANYDVMVHQNELNNYVQSNVPKNGIIAYSQNVKAFKGQMEFLAQEVFSKDKQKISWKSQNVSENTDGLSENNIYRAFYLSDGIKDIKVASTLLLPQIYIPSSTPQFEEKALMAFIWDKRYVKFFKDKLGESTFNILRKSIPKTWILGEEEFVDGGINGKKLTSLEVASLPKKQRGYVLKLSGYDDGSSWGESIEFLNKMGEGKAIEIVAKKLQDKNHLYIMQEYKRGKEVEMVYTDYENSGIPAKLNAKIRLTPYFSYIGKSKGKLIAVKVTGCDSRDRIIHAGSKSINTAVEIER